MCRCCQTERPGDAVAPLEAVLGPFANDPSWAIIIGPALKALAVTVGCALTEAALGTAIGDAGETVHRATIAIGKAGYRAGLIAVVQIDSIGWRKPPASWLKPKSSAEMQEERRALC